MKLGKLKETILIGVVMCSALLSGCISNHESGNENFVLQTPSEGKAGIYLYGDAGTFGAVFLGSFYIDGVCIGEASEDGYYYVEVESDKEHVFGLQAERAKEDLTLEPAEGHVYFVKMRVRGGQTMWQPQLRFTAFDRKFFNEHVEAMTLGCCLSAK